MNTFFFFMGRSEKMNIINKTEAMNAVILKEVARQMQSGELVIFPTDTVYGIRC